MMMHQSDGGKGKKDKKDKKDKKAKDGKKGKKDASQSSSSSSSQSLPAYHQSPQAFSQPAPTYASLPGGVLPSPAGPSAAPSPVGYAFPSQPAVTFSALPKIDPRTFDYYLHHPDAWRANMGTKTNDCFGLSRDHVYVPVDPESLAALAPFDMLLGSSSFIECWNWRPNTQHPNRERSRMTLIPPKNDPNSGWKHMNTGALHVIKSFSVSGTHVLGFGGTELGDRGMTMLWDLSAFSPPPADVLPSLKDSPPPELAPKMFTNRPHPCYCYGEFLGPFGSLARAVVTSRGTKTGVHVMDVGTVGLPSTTYEFPWQQTNLSAPQHLRVDPFNPDTLFWVSLDCEPLWMFDVRTLDKGPVLRISMFLFYFYFFIYYFFKKN